MKTAAEISAMVSDPNYKVGVTQQPVVTPNIPTTPKIDNIQPTVSPTEDRGKYMTGSGLQKFFDVLSTPQYASAGLVSSALKGKNIFKGMGEGIKTRKSYSDVLGEAGVTNKYAKAIGGFAGDVLLDPTTYIGGGAVKAGLKKIPGIAKVVSKAEKLTDAANLVNKFPALQKYGGAISNKLRTAGDVDYLKMMEKANTARGISDDVALDLMKKSSVAPSDIKFGDKIIKKGELLPSSIKKRLTQLLEQGAVTENPALKQIVSDVRSKTLEQGTELQKLGFLSKKQLQKNADTYLAGYRKLDVDNTGFGNALKLQMGRSKGKMSLEDWGQAFADFKGKDLSGLSDFEKGRRLRIYGKQAKDAYMVTDPTFRIGKGAIEEGRTIVNAKLFKDIDKTRSITKEAFEKMEPKIAQGYKLLPEAKNLGALSNKAVPNYIYQDLMGKGGLLSEEGSKIYDKVLSAWKAGKTVLSPSQQVRNVLSNQVLNYMVGGPGVITKYGQAAKSVKNKDEIYQLAKKTGLFTGSFNKNEFNKLANITDETAQGLLGKIKKGWGKAVEVGGNIQEKNEQIGKLQQFIYQMGKGKTAEQAKELAEKALFNYGDLTPFEKNYIKRIIPFYTFTRKAIPLTAETALKHPNRISIFNKAQSAINTMTPERAGERKMLPSYLKNAVRVPGTKKKYAALDYLYPWAGFLGESALPLGMNVPGYDIASKVISGYDPYYKSKLTESPLPEDQLAAKAKSVASTLMPSALQKVILPSSQKTFSQSMLGQAGLNVYDFDISKFSKNQQYQLRDLQSDLSSQMKKAAQIKNASLKSARFKRIQQYREQQIKKIIGNE